MEFKDTIAAIATASGIGSIAIVRLSGSRALEIALKITKKESIKVRYATLSTLFSTSGEVIDEAIVLYFKAPKSFTTEDVIEFQCHGGYVVANEILSEVLKLGARLANPGEFSKRAFLGGRIDLSEAEAIAGIIEAKSEDAARILARQIKGELRHFIEETRESLVRMIAYAEVTIDYAEEDLPLDLAERTMEQLEAITQKLKNILEASRRREGLMQGFRVSIIGKPNVGKSSLLNALLAYNRAIVSDIAGTTRDTIEESVRIGTHLVRIIDTAGIREAKDEIERIGIERSIQAIEDSELVVALFDGSRPLEEEDFKIITLLERYQKEKEIIVAINKKDLPKKIDETTLLSYKPVYISSQGDISQLLEKIKSLLDRQSVSEEILLISRRQIDAVAKALDALIASRGPLKHGELELFAYHIHDAIAALSSITRPFERGEILDKMFSEFCLGK